MSRRSEYDNPGDDYFENFAPAVSYDGKSRSYRDPNNQALIDQQISGDDYYDGVKRSDIRNKHSYSFMDPLYQESEADVNRAAQALEIGNIDEPDEAKRIKEYIANGFGKQETEAKQDDEPFEPTTATPERQERIDNAQADYDENFEGGRQPWQATSAMKSYTDSFDAAKNAGQDWDVGWYLRQRSDDKKAGVADYIGYLQDNNRLTQAENHNSAMNTISNLGKLGLKMPELDDPRESFEYYANRLRGISDDD